MLSIRNAVRAVALLALMLGFSVAGAADKQSVDNEDPEAVVSQVVSNALDVLAEDIDRLTDDEDAGRAFFDEQVLPWLDTDLMARFTMGRVARQASDEEIKRFTCALETRVANLYTSSLESYASEAEDFAENGEIDLRTVSQKDDRAVISAQISSPQLERTTLRIQLHRRDHRWRVFDVETSGVSMLLVFRDALRSAAQDDEVEAMIAALEEGTVEVEEAWEDETN